MRKIDKIAVISDIHGNIPALEAVFNDIRSRGIQKIICLGDLVGKGPNANIAVDMIRQNCEVVIRGNWDDFITEPSEEEMIRWHQQVLGDERLIYLKSLPLSIDFYMSGKLIRLFHASPKGVHYRVQPTHSLEERLMMFENLELTGKRQDQPKPDVVGYGDVHNAYMQNFLGKTLFNTGSVGNPLEITQASYVVLEGHYGSQDHSSFSVNFIRVPYDIALSIEQATSSEMPELQAYIHELRTAQYRGLKG